jgi:hypothetical protein
MDIASIVMMVLAMVWQAVTNWLGSWLHWL